MSNSPSKKRKLVFRSQRNNIQIIVFLCSLASFSFGGSWSSSPEGNTNLFWTKGGGWKGSFCDVSHNEGEEVVE